MFCITITILSDVNFVHKTLICISTYEYIASLGALYYCVLKILHFSFQSQPCHWRNMKSVRRRSVENPETASVAPRLSENISLFQSLRVLQEGEEDSELAANTGKFGQTRPSNR